MILDRIITHKLAEIAPLRKQYENWEPSEKFSRRDFAGALQREGISLITEFKRCSPSRGDLNVGADLAQMVKIYERNGAAALSVLTDCEFFAGTLDDLIAARETVSLPVLRKDFIIEPYQLAQSAGPQGPDCVLLIAALFDENKLSAMLNLAARCGQAALVEVHDEVELERALASGAVIIGINNRNLHTFEASLETTLRLRKHVPEGIPVVSESGIHSREDVLKLADMGVDAILVGEALMTATDPAVKIAELLGKP